MKNRHKNSQIEGLRGFAILLISCYHFFFRFFQLFYIGNFYNQFLLHWGEIGVSIFLMITGYFLLSTQNISCLEYFLRKILRLWPTYIVSITITFIVMHLSSGLPGRMTTVKEFIVNLFLVNGFIGVKSVDSAHWYLTTIIAFSFIISIIMGFKQTKNDYSYLLWMIVVMILSVCKQIPFMPSVGIIALNGLITIMGGGYVGFAVSGIIIRKIITGKIDCKLRCFVNLFFSIIYVYYFSGIIQSLLLILSGILVWCAATNKLKILEFPPLIWLGTISYSFYLIHQNIGYVIEYNLLQEASSPSYSISVIAWSATVLIGFLLYYAFERPVTLLFSQFYCIQSRSDNSVNARSKL